MIKLGVNIDHVATIWNARGENYPNPVRAALIAENNGADSITIHLREDRRHIKDNDIKNIKKNAELTYNYGYSYDADYVDHVCKCGSYKCVGYILDEDHWSKLKGKKKINP